MSGHQIAFAVARWATLGALPARIGQPTSVGLVPEAGVRAVEAITAVALIVAVLALRRGVQPEGLAADPRQRFGASAMSAMASTTWSEASARWRKPTLRQALAAVCVGCAVGLFIGGLGGVFVGPLAATAALVAGIRGASRAEQDRQRRLVASASAPVDLFAASLSAGLFPADAAAVVAVAYGGAGPVGQEAARVGQETAPVAVIAERFARSARALRAGADPETAWRPLMVDAATAAVGAAAVRSSRTGAPAARTAAAAAQECRAAARQAARAEIRAAAVRATAPLALCFLPAFVLVGIVPTALGLLAGLRT
jgi:hypothetical protein